MVTVLIVDDNPINARLLRATLLLAGFRVLTAPRSATARRVVRQADIVLLDIRLPDGNGLALTRELKADPETAQIPVIIVTAFLDDYSERVAYASGCDGYLTKPIDVQTLPAVVHETLARSNQRPRAAEQAPARRVSIRPVLILLAAFGAAVAAVRAWWK